MKIPEIFDFKNLFRNNKVFEDSMSKVRFNFLLGNEEANGVVQLVVLPPVLSL